MGPRQHAAVVVTWCSLLIGCGLWLPFTLGRYVLLAAAPLLPRAPPPALLRALLGQSQAGAPAAAAAAAQLGNATQARLIALVEISGREAKGSHTQTHCTPSVCFIPAPSELPASGVQPSLSTNEVTTWFCPRCQPTERLETCSRTCDAIFALRMTKLLAHS